IRDYKVTGVQTCALPIYFDGCSGNSGAAWVFDRTPHRGIPLGPKRSREGCKRQHGEPSEGDQLSEARGLFRNIHFDTPIDLDFFSDRNRSGFYFLLRTSKEGSTTTDAQIRWKKEGRQTVLTRYSSHKCRTHFLFIVTQEPSKRV